MGGKSEELNTRLTATDKASAVVDKLADKLEAIEDAEHEATLTADDKATAAVTALDKRLEGLTSEQQKVVLTAQTKQAQSEIDGLTRKLAQAWKYDDDTITLFVEERGNAEARLDAISAELRSLDGDSAKVEVTADTAKAKASLDDVAAKLGELDGRLGAVGGQLGKLASPGGAIAGIGAGLLLAGNYAADVAIEADNLARLTGDSVEEASKLNAVWKSAGFDAKDLQDVMLQMGGVLSTNAGLAAQLGINLDDGRTLGERFTQVVGLLETKFDSVAERSVAASQLFGEEGVRQVSAVIGSVGDLEQALNSLPQESVMSAEDVKEAREFKKEIQELTADVTSFAAAVGKVAIPVMSGLVNVFNDGFAGAEEFGRNIRGLFDGGAADKARKYAKSIAGADQAAGQFDKTLLDNVKSFDEAHAIGLKYAESTGLTEDALHAANLIAIEWKNSTDAVTAAAKEAAPSVQDMADKVEKATEEAGKLAAALPPTNAELRNMREDADSAWKGIRDLQNQFDLLSDSLSDSNAALALEDSFAQAQSAMEDAFIAEQEGSEDAEAAINDHKQTLNSLKQEVIDYARKVGTIPPETVTEILAMIDEDKLAEAEARIALLTAERVVPIVPVMGRMPAGASPMGNGPVARNPTGTKAPFIPEGAGATGAIINRPTVLLAGEAGREALIPLDQTAGNGPLPAGFGGGGPPINITVNAGVNADGPEIARIIANKLREYQRFNGPGR